MSKTPKTFEEKIAQRGEKIRQLTNEKKQIIQKQKADERKARTRRLCSRHGLLEKYMPDLIAITDEQFENFIKRAIDTTYGNQILGEITRKTSAAVASNHTNTADASTSATLSNPVATNGVSGGANQANATTASSQGNSTNPPKAAQSGA